MILTSIPWEQHVTFLHANLWICFQVPLKTASLEDLMERFSEVNPHTDILLPPHSRTVIVRLISAQMSRAEPHLGVNPSAPSQDEPTLTLEQVQWQHQSLHASGKMDLKLSVGIKA